MAINPNDFIFHSDLTPRQEVFSTSVDVWMGGGIGAGAYATFESAWIETGSTLQDIDFYVRVPGTVYGPNTTGSTFQGPVELNMTSDFAIAAVFVTIQNGTKVKCRIGCLNSYNFASTIPANTVTFTIKGYLPPAI